MKPAACILLGLSFIGAIQLAAQQAAPAPKHPAGMHVSGLNIPPLQMKILHAWVDWVKKNRANVEQLLADDAIEVWADGKGPHDKKSTLEGMEAMNIAHYTLSDFKITSLGEKSQMANYTAAVEFASADPKQHGPQFKLAVTEVWVKRGADWKLLHYQETEIK